MRVTTTLALSSVSVVALALAAPAAAKSHTGVAVAAAAAVQTKPIPCTQPDANGNCPQPAQTEASPPQQLPQSEAAIESGRAEGKVGENIVVTGTRINRPTLVSPVPVTSVGTQDLASQGNVSLGDKLAQLPQIRATFTQANSTRFIGTSGINALDLRGLGTARTLVLINGRRIITATPGVNRPDVNLIPAELVDRIDIVTGGNSAIYGSDAVAGVVNFILKRDFSGIRLNAQGGTSSRGDRGSYAVSLTAGRNFADGRGNVAVSGEYAKQETLYFTDRDAQTGAFSGRTQFNLVENTGPQLNPSNGPIRPGSEPSTGNGVPDNGFLHNVRNNSISEGGLFTASCPTVAATGETAAAFTARRALACNGQPNAGSSNPLSQFGATYVFQPDGTLIRNPCLTDLRGPTGGNSGNCVGGLGSTLRLTGMLEPGLVRKSLTLLAHYDISDALQPFIQATYANVHANQEGQPTFFNNTFSINNPFLSTQARTQLQAILAPGATTFAAQRFDIDFGGRGENHKRENYEIVGGFQGTFNGDWKYEASVNYGHLYTYYSTNGNLLRANYANALNAVRNTAGNIVCGINADAITTNDDPNCQPINLFGDGAPSQAALNYIGYKSYRKQRASLYNGLAYVSGDSSGFFNLPGGPVNFVVGAEYRKETAFAAYDPISSSLACGAVGCTFLNILPDFKPPALKVWDLFGELNVPILKDLPFAQELSVDGAARYSHYNLNETKGVFAWNVNGIWAPVRDLRFRAGYARSIRAPTLSDLFSAPTQTFVNGLVDPCGQQNINNGPQVGGQSVRIQNCRDAGVPTTQTFNGTTEPFTNRPTSGIAANSQGNPNLKEEKG
jgi:outer membrane receptor protein involved in Fe transport